MNSLLHIDTVGRGPSLVLLHGWAMHSGAFASLVPVLSQHFQLHLVDLPGHGRSRDTRDLVLDEIADTVMMQLGGRRAIWAGWSLGGLVALHAAREHPAQVSGVALMASSPCFVIKSDWSHGVPVSVFEQFAQGLSQHFQATVERFLALETLGNPLPSEAMKTLHKDTFAHGAPDLHALQQGLQLLQQEDRRADVVDLRVPSLWIAGRRDRLVSPRAMQWAAEAAPQGQYLELDAGHMPFLTHPDAVIAALVNLGAA